MSGGYRAESYRRKRLSLAAGAGRGAGAGVRVDAGRRRSAGDIAAYPPRRTALHPAAEVIERARRPDDAAGRDGAHAVVAHGLVRAAGVTADAAVPGVVVGVDAASVTARAGARGPTGARRAALARGGDSRDGGACR